MIRVVSLFCGGGFAEEALRIAAERSGIPVEVVMAVDSWEPAARVRDANFGGVRTTLRSVKEMTRNDLPPHDLVIGGPPCQDHSLAGKRACQCNVGEPAAERCCLADFVRLASGSAWLMENVRPRLIRDGWREQFCAANFGDVTSRKRWFYSSHLLHVAPTPGPRRLRDIRDHEADRIAHDRRYAAQMKRANDARRDDAYFGSLTADAPHNTNLASLKVGLRGHSASASAFEDGDVLGTFVSNSWHGNELGKLGPSVRCPSLLEMARAHSIPDTWDWAGVTKTQRGQIIANGWPIGLGAALCEAMLRAFVAERLNAVALGARHLVEGLAS